MPPQKNQSLNLFGAAQGADSPRVAERRALLQLWARDPWEFLTGHDVDGTPLIWTKDEGNEKSAYNPFPSYPYLKHVLDELMGPQQFTLIDKSRQMLVSTLCMLLLYHTVLFSRGRKCLVSKQTQELAETLLEDKVRGVHRRTPVWFQQALPLSMTPKSVARAERTESEIVCMAQNAAATWLKGNTATITLIDEAAVQEYLEDMLEAAKPMSRRIWVPTTAFHGNPGAAFFRQLVTEV